MSFGGVMGAIAATAVRPSRGHRGVPDPDWDPFEHGLRCFLGIHSPNEEAGEYLNPQPSHCKRCGRELDKYGDEV